MSLKNILQNIFLISYEMLWACLQVFVNLFRILIPKYGKYFRSSSQIKAYLQELESIKKSSNRRVMFYCSSAGEYEQAIPVIDLFIEKGWAVHIVFFSFSGFYFANKRNDPYFYFQNLTDRPRYWKKVFDAFDPECTVVVRHELWPGFIHYARRNGHLAIVDLNKPLQHRRKSFFAKRKLLTFFQTLYCVEKSDQSFYREIFPNKRILNVGETKYDRVCQRIDQASPTTVELASWLDIRKIKSEKRKMLVFGSCWQEEMQLFKKVLPLLSKSIRGQLAVVVAPHDVSKAMTESILSELSEAPISPVCFRYFRTRDQGADKPKESDEGVVPVLILNVMGKLAECYSFADFSFVGGALKSKIHNVLEPAIYGNPIGHGPHFYNQKEAVELAQENLSTIIRDEFEMASWIEACIRAPTDSKMLSSFMEKKLGASRRIVDDLVNILYLGRGTNE